MKTEICHSLSISQVHCHYTFARNELYIVYKMYQICIHFKTNVGKLAKNTPFLVASTEEKMVSSHDVATSMSCHEQGTSPMTPQLPLNEPTSLHDEHVPRLERLLSFRF